MRSLRASTLRALLALALACTEEDFTPLAPVEDNPHEVFAPTTGKWWDGAVFYEVFVRSFQDSNGDGKGDLQGLISRLDYLNDGDPSTTGDLGVDALWLMPVFASPSYHGYDVTDYETIAPDYGTNADLDALVAAAHARGMKVIVDLVLNHTSSQHPWFLDSASSPASAKRGWYVWSATNPGWGQPWGTAQTWYALNGAYYYGLFWSGMPDLNFLDPEVRAEAERIAKLWLGHGVDGFRLDAIRYLVEDGPAAGQADTPETHAYLKELAAQVRGANPDAALVGEVWTDPRTIASYYGNIGAVPGGDEIPMNFDFPLADAIVRGVGDQNAAAIGLALATTRDLFPAGTTGAPFLTNHDMVRIASQVGSGAFLRSAAAILLTVPGSPFIYYGEELGMQNGPTGNDEAKRLPMAWDASSTAGFTTGTPWYPLPPGYQATNVAAETGDPSSLLSRYRQLIRARALSPALAHGGIRILSSMTAASTLLAFIRYHPQDRVLVAHNLQDGPVTSPAYAIAGTLEPLFVDDGGGANGGSGSWTVTLPPRGTGIWRIRQ